MIEIYVYHNIIMQIDYEASPICTPRGKRQHVYPQVRDIKEQLTTRRSNREMKTIRKICIHTHAPSLLLLYVCHISDIDELRQIDFKKKPGCARRSHTRLSSAGLAHAQREWQALPKDTDVSPASLKKHENARAI